MGRTRMKTVRAFNKADLEDRIQQARTDLAKLKMQSARGTLRKESGKLRPLRRDIARMMTRLTELERK